MRLPPREGKPHAPFILFSDDDAESPIILWEQRVEGMFHHGLTADHTDESAITIHHRQFLELLLGEDSGHLSNMLVGSGGNDLTRGDVHHLFAGERLHLGGHGFVVEHHHRRTGAGGNRTGFIGGNRFQDIAVADEADEPAIAVHHGKAGDVEADELAHHMRDVIAVQAAVGLIVHDLADGLFLGLLEQGGGGGHVCAGVVMLGGLAFSGFDRDFGGGLRLVGLGVTCGLLLGTAGDGEDADDQGDQRDGGAQQVGERDAAGRGGLHTLGHVRSRMFLR